MGEGDRWEGVECYTGCKQNLFGYLASAVGLTGLVIRLFGVQKAVAEKSGWNTVWLKNLAAELADENPSEPGFFPRTVLVLRSYYRWTYARTYHCRYLGSTANNEARTESAIYDVSLSDKCVLQDTEGSRSDDLEFLPVLASLPPQQTVFEYLVGCWKRLNQARSALNKRVCYSLTLTQYWSAYNDTHRVILRLRHKLL